jgi:uncharacterized membrane protein
LMLLNGVVLNKMRLFPLSDVNRASGILLYTMIILYFYINNFLNIIPFNFLQLCNNDVKLLEPRFQ